MPLRALRSPSFVPLLLHLCRHHLPRSLPRLLLWSHHRPCRLLLLRRRLLPLARRDGLHRAKGLEFVSDVIRPTAGVG